MIGWGLVFNICLEFYRVFETSLKTMIRMVMSGDPLIWLINPGLIVGTLCRQRNFIFALLVNPFNSGVFFSLNWTELFLGKGTCLSVNKCISQNSFFLLQFRGALNTSVAVAICIPKRILIECEREGSLALLVQTMFIFLQLLDEGGFNF